MASHFRTNKVGRRWIISMCLVAFIVFNSKPVDSLKIPNLLSAALGVGSPSSSASIKNQQQQQLVSPASSSSSSSASTNGLNQKQQQQQIPHSNQLFQAPSTQQTIGSGRSIGKPFQSLLPTRHHALLFNSLPKSLFGRLTASSSAATQSASGPTSAGPKHQSAVYNLPLLMHYHKKMKSLGLGKAPQLFSPLSTANTEQIEKFRQNQQQGIDMNDYVDLASLLQQSTSKQVFPVGSRYPYGPDGSSNSQSNNNNINGKAHSVPHHLIALSSVPLAQQLETIRSSKQKQQPQQVMFAVAGNQDASNQLQQQQSIMHPIHDNSNKVIVPQQQQQQQQQQRQHLVAGNTGNHQQLLDNMSNNLKDDIKAIEDIGMLVDEELRKLELNLTNNHQQKELFPDLFINGTILKTAIENSIAEENLNRNNQTSLPHVLLAPSQQVSNTLAGSTQAKQFSQPPTKGVNVTELVSAATNQQQNMNNHVKKNISSSGAVNNVTQPIESHSFADKSKLDGEIVRQQRDNNTSVNNSNNKEAVEVRAVSHTLIASVANKQKQHQLENMETSATASNVARLNAVSVANLDDPKVEKFILGPYRGPQVVTSQHYQHGRSFPMSHNLNYPFRSQHHPMAFDHQQQQSSAHHQVFYQPQHHASSQLVDTMVDLNSNIQIKQQQQPHFLQHQEQKLFGNTINNNNNNKNDNLNQVNQIDHHRPNHPQQAAAAQHHHHQMMRENNPTAIVELADPVHMVYQPKYQGNRHQHLQMQHLQQDVKGNNEAPVSVHHQYNNQAQRHHQQQQQQHHHHHQQKQQQQRPPLGPVNYHQQESVDSAYRLEQPSNNRQLNNNFIGNNNQQHAKASKYITDADNNKLNNNVVNNHKLFHGQYQQQPSTQHQLMRQKMPNHRLP